MALSVFRNYKTVVQSHSGLMRYAGRSYATAARLEVPYERSGEHARKFRLYTKSHIATLFEHYAPNLDPVSYLAAAQVFPMRANSYVVEDLIDWSVSNFVYTVKILQQSDTSSSGPNMIIFTLYSVTVSRYCSNAKPSTNTTGPMYPAIQFSSLFFLNQQCFPSMISIPWSLPFPNQGSPEYLYNKRRRRFVLLSIRILQPRKKKMCLSCTIKRYLVRSTSTVKQYSSSPQRSNSHSSNAGGPCSLTVGSILSFFLYLLLPLGSIYLRWVGATIPVQRSQAP